MPKCSFTRKAHGTYGRAKSNFSSTLIAPARGLRALVPMAAAAAVVLSGCSTFSLSEPSEGADVRSPSTVTVQASPSMSGLVVKVDGTDVSNQILPAVDQNGKVSDQKSQGNLTLPLGLHTITAEADVPCWYCDHPTYHRTDEHTFCVGTQVLGPDNRIATAESGEGSWFKDSTRNVGVRTDNGTPAFRWNLIRFPGVLSGWGFIQSADDSCLCMCATNGADGPPIRLVLCDLTGNDHTQVWQAFLVSPGVYRFDNQANNVSLTVGKNGALVQGWNHDAPNQHWKITDNTGQPADAF